MIPSRCKQDQDICPICQAMIHAKVWKIPVLSAACPGALDELSLLLLLLSGNMPFLQGGLQPGALKGMGFKLSLFSCRMLFGCLLPPLCKNCLQPLPFKSATAQSARISGFQLRPGHPGIGIVALQLALISTQMPRTFSTGHNDGRNEIKNACLHMLSSWVN